MDVQMLIKEKLGEAPRIVASSPGRADFLNTHQDYKGLPVVPVAINLRTYIFAKPLKEDVFIVRSLDLEERGETAVDTFRVGKNDMLERGWFGNYFRGIVNVIVKEGLIHKLRGMHAIVKSEIPIGSGLSSSAALEVAFATLLNHFCELGYNENDLAEIAYLAETGEVGVPCGRLDQYGVAFGGIIKLECRPPYKVEPLPFTDLTWVVLDSGIRHSTAEIHPFRQADIDRGLTALMKDELAPEKLKAKLGYRYDQPMWEKITEQEIERYLPHLDERASKRILFTIRMQKSTEFALQILRLEKISEQMAIKNLGKERWKLIKGKPLKERSHRILGEIMNDQQTLLRDLYEVSLPEIDNICTAALEAGAYGAKLSGAGMGGSIIALIRDIETGHKVVEAGLSAGAEQGWVLTVGTGARMEPSS